MNIVVNGGKMYKNYDDIEIPIFIKIIPIVIFIVFLGSICVYAQDVGEVCILRNWGGQLASTTEEAGFHLKAPWQTVIRYDIRNNIVNLYRDSEYDYDNGTATGAEVTVYDKSGAQANVDVQVIYSLDPDAAVALYKNYQKQENFVQIVAVNNVRDAARNCSGKFTTIQLLTDREQYAKTIFDKLNPEWAELGLHVQEVNVQDIRYADEIVAAYNNAQKTEISKQEAVNEQEAEKVKIETQILKAQGEAEANTIRSQSLTPEILQQEYIEALKNGKTIYIVPENGSTVVIPDNSSITE